MFLLIYFIVSILVLYTEAKDCYTEKVRFDVVSELIFSFTWVVSLPFAIYTIWKEFK